MDPTLAYYAAYEVFRAGGTPENAYRVAAETVRPGGLLTWWERLRTTWAVDTARRDSRQRIDLEGGGL